MAALTGRITTLGHRLTRFHLLIEDADALHKTVWLIAQFFSGFVDNEASARRPLRRLFYIRALTGFDQVFIKAVIIGHSISHFEDGHKIFPGNIEHSFCAFFSNQYASVSQIFSQRWSSKLI